MKAENTYEIMMANQPVSEKEATLQALDAIVEAFKYGYTEALGGVSVFVSKGIVNVVLEDAEGVVDSVIEVEEGDEYYTDLVEIAGGAV